MLRTLELFDFAIADAVALALGPGLTVLSGETGAGKSLLVDALALLAGNRAEVGVIRAGEASALVQATFSDPEGWTVSRRVVREGRNIARINGEVVSVSELQESLVARLGIFGQQAFRTLLDPAEQRALLDRHLGDDAERARIAMRAAHAEREGLRRQLLQLEQAGADRERQLELLRYQLQEIDAAQLQPDEEQSLDGRLSTLRNVERVRAGVTAALFALAAEERGASDTMAEGLRALHAASRFDPSLAASREEFDELLTRTRALIRSLEDALEGLESDPGELDRCEERRSLIEALERKYGHGVRAILAHRERAAHLLAEVEDADASGVELRARERDLGAQLIALAERVSRGRRQAAAALAPQVEAALRRLNLPHARFAIELQPRESIGASGAERVVFHFSANLGEPLAPLTEVASGGELSRVMLALHAAAGSTIPTLVFDEVDAGLGGRSGRAVGEMLAQLARGRQVLVVTHLAQVAAFADHHLRVDKQEADGRTRTVVTRLSEAERVTEIARMLAGSDSEEARDHARALLRRP